MVAGEAVPQGPPGTRSWRGLAGDNGWNGQLLFSEHHLSHAASAFFPSPFEEAVVLTMDGVGEWATTSAAIGKGDSIEVMKEIHFPHSLGLLYSAFTYYTGFKVNSGEYKVMGLAPYGEPKYAAIDPRSPDGRQGRRVIQAGPVVLRLLRRPDHDQPEIRRSFRGSAAEGGQLLTQRHMDLAASDSGGHRRSRAAVDAVTARGIRDRESVSGRRRRAQLGRERQRSCAMVDSIRIYIQPAAGDAGGALGAALAGYHMQLGQTRRVNGDAMRGAYLGPAFAQTDIEARLKSCGAKFDLLEEAALTEPARKTSRRAKRSGGSRDAWSSAPARWATARSWAIRARRRCKKRSTSKSSTASPSDRLRRRCCASE